MENKLIKQFKTPASLCDNNARLAFWAAFSIFGDLASEHGTDLKIGMEDLAEKNCIWVISKTKVHFIKRPEMLRQISASTWPAPAGKIRCNRYYTISDENGILIEGKSEWAVIDINSGRPQKIADIYPAGIEFLTETVCDEPFTRFNDDFSAANTLDNYTVRTTDIDTSQHMNNVAYIRAVSGIFKKLSINTNNITDIEIAYKLQCYEGETLTFKALENENGTEIGVIKEDGSTAAVIMITVE